MKGSEGWPWRMAWRNFRHERRRWLWLTVTLMMAVAAVVLLLGLRQAAAVAVAVQARELLGADVVVEARRRFTLTERERLQSLGVTRAEEINCSTMIYFPRSGGSRLVQLSAVSEAFPLYGQMVTEPASAAQAFQATPSVLLEETLWNQFNARIGDVVKIGSREWLIAGIVKKAPGRSMAFNALAPRVYLSLKFFPESELLGRGALARYLFYLRFPVGAKVDSEVATWKPWLTAGRLSHETVAMRQKNLSQVLEPVGLYLGLVGMVAMVLGGLGVASAAQAQVQEQKKAIALLRCLGAPLTRTLQIYRVQLGLTASVGAIGGVALGYLLYAVTVRCVSTYLPLTLDPHLSWSAAGTGVMLGWVMSVLFAAGALRQAGQISPLLVLRDDEFSRRSPWDHMRTVGAIGLGLVLFAWWQTDSWRWAGSIAGAVGAAFGVVALMTWGVLKWARRFMRPSWPYAWRQGWSNLYRPQNQTWMILSVLGVSVFLSTTLVLMEDSLRREIAWESPEHQANVILFDLQPEQRAGMQHLLGELQVMVLHEVPIVTMRLATVKGRSVTEILRDPRHTEPDWILRREFRSSYRQDLRPTEKLTAGTWVGQQAGGGAGIPISVEEGLARDLKLQLGDVLTFDVQGVPMTTKVASLRQVDWRRFEPNFFVLFPTGVLEQAPAFYVSFIHTDNALVQAKLQRTIMEQYPNVSVLDLNLVLETVHRMLDQAGLAARGLMGLSVLTAVLVAWGALGLNSRQRQQESVLLRTLGASQTQLRHILWVEYASLGALGGMIGVGLASLAAWAFAHWGLKSELHLHFGNLVFAELLSIGLTMGLGGLWSRQVAQSPVLTWGARHR